METAKALGTWSAGEGRIHVELSLYGTGGNGICGIISGGEKAHVGGTAYATPRQRSSGDGLTADVSSICGFGHKDVYAAQAIAKKICVAVGETVCITAGIHVNHASDQDLANLQKNCDLVAEDFIQDYLHRN